MATSDGDVEGFSESVYLAVGEGVFFGGLLQSYCDPFVAQASVFFVLLIGAVLWCGFGWVCSVKKIFSFCGILFLIRNAVKLPVKFFQLLAKKTRVASVSCYATWGSLMDRLSGASFTQDDEVEE
nr:hypothetical protein [Bacillota bacterium]